MRLYEEKKLLDRSNQLDMVFNTIIDYSHKEEISSAEKAFFLNTLNDIERLCIGGNDFHYQYVTAAFLELVFQLKNLKYLDMSYLRIDGPGIGSMNLLNLECLLARNSGLLELPCNICKSKKLKYLDLSNNNINTIPDSIGELINLEELDLSGTDIRILPVDICKLKKLCKLDLSCTNLRELPECFFADLNNLEIFSIKNTNINELSPQICNLKRLKKLGWGNKKTTQLPADQLISVPAIEYLDISGTSIIELPDEIYDILPNIKGLDLEYTSISNDSIKAISKLKDLEFLNLKSTKVNSIDKSILYLRNLKFIDLSSTAISSLSDSISGLCKLKEIYLNDTPLQRLPSDLSELYDLEVLELENTKVNLLPQDIGKLKKLQKLRISGTAIQILPNSMALLKNIKWLYIEGMTIKELPEFILDYNLKFYDSYHGYPYNLQGIFIDGLKLIEQPIEIFSQSRELIRAYYNSHERTPINECKVIFLGDAESGKTHSIKRLLDKGEYLNDFDGESTPGIETTVSRIQIKDSEITVNYWDFGGQEIQHSMHRVFLTERTVYVVFLNARQDDLMDERARYWLENIMAFAPEAPVLVVINKIDQNEHPRFNEKGFLEAYGSQVRKVIRISAKTDTPQAFLDKLEGNINSIIMGLPTVSKKVPKSWKNLMESIRTMPEHYLTTDEFKEKCISNRVANYQEIHDDLVDLFQVIGISFCYYKKRAIADYMLLNPKWMLNALYTIVTNGKAIAGNGVITQNELFDLLQKDTINGVKIRRVIPDLHYKGFEINYILGVIRMFGLSYCMKDGSEFFPMLCDGDEKISVKDAVPENALHFIFRYAYLPTNVIHRLIVEMQRDLDYRYVWYTGAVFRNILQNQSAYVHSMGNDLHIYVYGEDKEYSLNEYLTPISNTVRSINLDMGLSAKELLSFQKNDVEVALPFKEVMGNLRRRTFMRYVSEIDDEIDYRDISRRYFDEYPKKDDELLQCIIKALSILQNDMTFYRTQENSGELENRRNRFVSEQLLMAKYSCSDQQPGGITASGKAPGERDFVVKNKNGVDFLIYEGLNLTTLDKSYVNEHIKKLLVYYNPMGLRQSVLVTYLECGRNEFKSFTDKYRKQISEYAPESYRCVGEPKEFPTPGQFMSCMVMNYETGGLYFVINHIIVRVAP